MANPEKVVDYAAWRKGYMQSSEHVLIDQLAFRGARVVLGTDFGDLAFWVVVRGKTPSAAVRRKLMEMLDMAVEETPAADSVNGSLTKDPKL